MTESLLSLLNEPIESVKHRERSTLDDLLRIRNNRIVLFGSGNLGRRAADALRSIGINPLAFSDNNKARWGTEQNGIEIISPIEASRRYGSDSVFLVTIWNEFHWFQETQQQLRSAGADLVVPYFPLHWRFPEVFLPCLLNDLPHKVYEERSAVLTAAEVWEDQESREIYAANIRLRALGDLSGIPGRPQENTYFPLDIFSLLDDDRFLDCGATNGEMTQDLIRKVGDHFAEFSAIEADNISFVKLEAYRESLPPQVRSKLVLYKCAVGADKGVVHFAQSGGTGSRISEEGIPVDCLTIDELFRDKLLTFIKMDIEGAEWDTLRGAASVIVRDQPVLAICVYHTQNDIWRIPLLVRELLPEHKLYLRSYEGDGYQTLLYAVPQRRIVKSRT